VAAVLAALPLLAVVLGMTALRWSAAMAGSAGLMIAAGLVIAGIAPTDLPGDLATGATGTVAEALFSTLTILWIILPALVLFEFQSRTGAITRIRAALAGLTTDRRLQVILIAWFFGLFIEGAAGFGAPVALSAPLLAGMGYPPVRAVALALLGHAAGVSFGAVGTPTLTQVGISGLDPRSLAGTIALLHVVPGVILLLATMRLAGDGPLSRADYGWAAVAALAFFVPSVALASLVGPELPSLAGALLGAAVFVAMLRRAGGGRTPPAPGLLADLSPYLVIVAFVIVTRLVDPLATILKAPAVSWTLGDGTFRGSFQPLFHPGTILIAGLLTAALAIGRGAAIAPATRNALQRLLPVALALAVMLTLSRLMVHAGMIGELAATAALTGAIWPLIAPLVGVLGTFITGSATASNILFTELQLSAARDLALPAVAMTAAQGFGSAVGNVIAPHNIIAGCATVGLAGREGEILRRTALPALAALALGGSLLLFFVAG
jgi:lactate permease